MRSSSFPGEAADERRMGLALALGRRNLGRTWPNPSVGAVLVDPTDGRILGTGVTQPGGRPHGEPMALRDAGERARGATLYVSLEPCSHHGKSPPCTDAAIGAGIARVVSAMEDPDPRVAGRGHALLRAAGIEVVTGVLGDAARRDHRGHVARVTLGRPAVTMKLARTSDGYAGRRGARLFITGEATNARTHLLRAHADAIMVGISTVLADDPRLDVRLPGLANRSPVRVVLDSFLRLSPSARLASGARTQPTWVVCREDADVCREASLTAAGAAVIRVAGTPSGTVDLASALRELAVRGLTRVLCEGGPTLADALAAQDFVDEMVLITGEAPLGEAGTPALGAALAERLAHFTPTSDDRLGPDRVQLFERP